jgi:hypothetical protein
MVFIEVVLVPFWQPPASSAGRQFAGEPADLAGLPCIPVRQRASSRAIGSEWCSSLEEATDTLLCGDLFSQAGNPQAVTSDSSWR